MAREIFKNLPDTSTPINATKLNGVFNGEESMGSIVVEDIICKNLFDKGNIFTNKALNDGDGTVFEATNRNTTDFINVKPNSDYIFSNISRTAVCLYDNNKTFIKTLTNNLIATTSNTYYLRFTYKTDEDYSKGQLELGSVATDYTPYKKIGYNSQESMGEIVVDDITCKNILDTSNIVGKSGITAVRNSDGTWTFNGTPTGNYVNFLNINSDILEDGKTYTFSSTNYNKQVYLQVERKNKSTGATNYHATQEKSFTLTIDKTTYSYVIAVQTHSIANTGTISNLKAGWQLEKGSVATKFVEHKEFSNKQIYSTNEQVIGTWTDGKPLYRKTISINTPPTTDNTEVYNFDTNFIIKNYYGFVTISASSQLIPINFYFTNEYNVATYITKNTGKINMKVGSEAYTNQQVTISLEYTKTTD